MAGSGRIANRTISAISAGQTARGRALAGAIHDQLAPRLPRQRRAEVGNPASAASLSKRRVT
jgi:hypothetical protein